MTLQDAIQQNEPFTCDLMLDSGCERFLMFIDNRIMFFDNDGESNYWLAQYNLNYGHECKIRGNTFYLLTE